MSDVVERVRAFYEQYPYPEAEGIRVRADAFPGWLIAQVDREPWPRTLRALDAGCGTGDGLAGVAALQPELDLVGVDLSAASIAQARRRLAGHRNARLMVADLCDPDAVAVLRAHAPEGYDVIWCSGVLHHVGEPARMLAALRALLAPDGVISLMVYAHYGRLPATRLRRALELAAPEGGGARRDLARALLGALEPGPILRGPFEDGPTVGEVELADRYLHPHAAPMRAAELVGLLRGAGLRWLRWLEPRAWSPAALLGPGEAASALEALDPLVQATVLEELFDHPALECLVTHADRGDRPPPEEDPLGVVVDVNPQVSLSEAWRPLGPVRVREGVSARLRAGPREALSEAEAAVMLSIAGPITGAELVAERRLDPVAVVEVLPRLLARELLYRPV